MGAVLVGILVVALGVGFSIAVHELGHMIPAKLFGVRVDKYMIGFGPTLWSRQIGETLYGLKALPLGGFCRMVGMLPPAPPGHVAQKGYFGEVVTQARADSVNEILPGEEGRAFYNLSAPKKVLIMAGGILANLLLAFLFTAIAFSIPTTQGIDPATPGSNIIGSLAEAPAAAATAGLQIGDQILEFNGHPINTWAEVQTTIAGTPAGHPVPVTVNRGGEQMELEITPLLSADGSRSVIGVGPETVRRAIPLRQVPGAVGEMMVGTFQAVSTFPVAVFEVARAMITGAPRPGGGVMSVVGVGRAAAEVAGVDAPISDIVATMFALVASLNMALFAFNLIPLLPFDGGHVVNALFEGGRRTLARIRGIRPLPGPADVARMLPVAYVVTPLLVLSFIVLILADVISPISIFG